MNPYSAPDCLCQAGPTPRSVTLLLNWTNPNIRHLCKVMFPGSLQTPVTSGLRVDYESVMSGLRADSLNVTETQSCIRAKLAHFAQHFLIFMGKLKKSCL